MTAAPAVWAVLADILWCLGLGCLLCAGHDLLCLLLGSGPVRYFFWDLLTFAVAAVLVCGFSAGVSASGLARWYMTAGMLAGALAWHATIRPAVNRFVAVVLRILIWPLRTLQRRLLKPLAEGLRLKVGHIRCRHTDKKAGKTAKNGKKQLQNPSKILYN